MHSRLQYRLMLLLKIELMTALAALYVFFNLSYIGFCGLESK